MSEFSPALDRVAKKGGEAVIRHRLPLCTFLARMFYNKVGTQTSKGRDVLPMTNRQIANILFNIATLLDMAQDNVYRVRAYRRAARRLLALREEATVIVARGEELPLPGVGARIRRKLAELLADGAMAFYDELLEDASPPVRALMALDGIGPKTALRLSGDLGITTAEQLIAAAEQGKINKLHGFGHRREALLAQAARVAPPATPAAA